MKCTATTRRGAPCRNQALQGSDRCATHRVPAAPPEAVQLVLQMLRAGNYLAVAARAAGVTVEQLFEHLEVVEDIDEASAVGEVQAVGRIAQAARDNWQAAAWLLERQYPDRWGRPAVRQEEKPPPPIPERVPDRLDELAGRRSQRRAGLA